MNKMFQRLISTKKTRSGFFIPAYTSRKFILETIEKAEVSLQIELKL